MHLTYGILFGQTHFKARLCYNDFLADRIKLVIALRNGNKGVFRTTYRTCWKYKTGKPTIIGDHFAQQIGLFLCIAIKTQLYSRKGLPGAIDFGFGGGLQNLGLIIDFKITK